MNVIVVILSVLFTLAAARMRFYVDIDGPTVPYNKYAKFSNLTNITFRIIWPNFVRSGVIRFDNVVVCNLNITHAAFLADEQGTITEYREGYTAGVFASLRDVQHVKVAFNDGSSIDYRPQPDLIECSTDIYVLHMGCSQRADRDKPLKVTNDITCVITLNMGPHKALKGVKFGSVNTPIDLTTNVTDYDIERGTLEITTAYTGTRQEENIEVLCDDGWTDSDRGNKITGYHTPATCTFEGGLYTPWPVIPNAPPMGKYVGNNSEFTLDYEWNTYPPYPKIYKLTFYNQPYNQTVESEDVKLAVIDANMTATVAFIDQKYLTAPKFIGEYTPNTEFGHVSFRLHVSALPENAIRVEAVVLDEMTGDLETIKRASGALIQTRGSAHSCITDITTITEEGEELYFSDTYARFSCNFSYSAPPPVQW